MKMRPRHDTRVLSMDSYAFEIGQAGPRSESIPAV
jgi:hypothetical protein